MMTAALLAPALLMLCVCSALLWILHVLCRYFAAKEVEDVWCVYPWDADDIYAHTEVAEGAGTHLPNAHRSKRQSSGCSPVQPSNGHGSHACQERLRAAASNGHVGNGADTVAVGNGSHI
jgi:hypothetical protein